MTAAVPADEQVRQELEKAATMVSAARRLLSTGTMVDLAALEGKVRFICDTIGGMGRDKGRVMLPVIEALLADLDVLESAIRDRYEPI